MNKKKILFASEASYLNSGYGNYYKELINRLYKLDKYDIAEFASYGVASDPRVKFIPWRFYPNMPESYEKEEQKKYKDKVINEFGNWRFDRVVLDFKPDIVVDIRDPYMNMYQRYSPLRNYFSWLIMPTVDSAPQCDEWVDTFITAEGVLTYTEWGKQVLDHEGGGKINTLGATPHCINYDIFSPIDDKAAHKEKFGISGDSFIVGTVMRNQKRKLFSDLMQSFAMALDKLPPDQAKKTYLYIHTSYPDKTGWDIPKLVKESGIGTKLLFSYICKLCRRPSCMIFQDAKTLCPHCNNVACVTPTVGFGHSNEEMADVYRLFDLFVQYSICEGLGLPQIEAAGCGIPVASVDYSAMHDVVNRIGGYPIKVKHLFREFESHAYRAYPDNEHLADIIVKHINLPQDYRNKLSKRTLDKAKQYFNWDRIIKIWESSIDNLPAAKYRWDDPPRIFQPAQSIPEGVSSTEYVSWLLNNVYYQPEATYNLMGLELVQQCNFKVSIRGNKVSPITPEQIHKSLIERTEGRNLAEKARCGLVTLPEPNFIRFAKERLKK